MSYELIEKVGCRSTEDDWAANEVVLQDEDDGWGGSYVNKQSAQQSRWNGRIDSSKADASSQDRQDNRQSSWDAAGNESAASQSFKDSERGDPTLRQTMGQRVDGQRGQYSRPVLQQPQTEDAENLGPEATLSDEASPEEALEAEVLEDDSSWETSEEDWEEGALPDITPLAPDEAVRHTH